MSAEFDLQKCYNWVQLVGGNGEWVGSFQKMPFAECHGQWIATDLAGNRHLADFDKGNIYCNVVLKRLVADDSMVGKEQFAIQMSFDIPEPVKD